MNILYYYKDTKTFEIKEYNGSDISKPIIGLDKNIELYWINEIYPEIINTHEKRYSGKINNEYTEELHPEYKHFKIVNRVHLVEEIPMEQVIENLNQSYGNYLDEQYPQVERQNHVIEMQLGTTTERANYITKLQDWLMECKIDRKNRIENYIINDEFPSFENFIVKP